MPLSPLHYCWFCVAMMWPSEPGQVVRAAPCHVAVTCGRPLPCLSAGSTVWRGRRGQPMWQISSWGLVTPIIANNCSAVEFTYEREGTTPDGFPRPHRGLEVTCKRHGQSGYQTDCLEETDLSCINVFCLSSLQYSMLDTLWLSMLSIKRFYNLIHHQTIVH